MEDDYGSNVHAGLYKSVRFRVSVLERFCYKGFLRNSSGTKFFVRFREVSALEDVRSREVLLYPDYIWRHVCKRWFSIIFTSSTGKEPFFSVKSFLCRLWFCKKKLEQCFTFKLNLNITNFTMYFNKKTGLNCIIFEANKYIYRNGYLRSCWL